MIVGEVMKGQTYYNATHELMANVCDMTKELCVNCTGVVDDSRDFVTHSIRRDYYMIYILEGSMNVEFEDIKSVMSQGDLLIIKPETEYLYYAKQGSGINYLWIHFTGNKAENIVKEFSVPLNRICKCGCIGMITEYWKKLFHEFMICDEYFERMTTAVFVEIMSLFSRRLKNTDAKERLFKSVMYIHENFRNKISVNQLAKMENMSESHYRTVFTSMYGESPIEYIISRRIEAAVNMLENTDKSLNEISCLSGYNDMYYFAKQFKRKPGISPGKYRKNKSIAE